MLERDPQKILLNVSKTAIFLQVYLFTLYTILIGAKIRTAKFLQRLKLNSIFMGVDISVDSTRKLVDKITEHFHSFQCQWPEGGAPELKSAPKPPIQDILLLKLLYLIL